MARHAHPRHCSCNPKTTRDDGARRRAAAAQFLRSTPRPSRLRNIDGLGPAFRRAAGPMGTLARAAFLATVAPRATVPSADRFAALAAAAQAPCGRQASETNLADPSTAGGWRLQPAVMMPGSSLAAETLRSGAARRVAAVDGTAVLGLPPDPAALQPEDRHDRGAWLGAVGERTEWRLNGPIGPRMLHGDEQRLLIGGELRATDLGADRR